MQSAILAIIFFLVSAVASASFYRFDGLIVAMATILGFVLGRTNQLHKEMDSLRAAMAKDWEQRHKSILNTAPSVKEKTATEAVSQDTISAQQEPAEKLSASYQTADTIDSSAEQTSIPQSPIKPSYQQTIKPPAPASSPIDKAISLVKGYFTGGNLFVRIGILILFFGVSFLLKYAADRGAFPIEYRLMAVAIGAISLLLFGWLLRHKKQTYGLLLQGAGIGLLYLDIFAAFSLYHLIPPLPAFALMFVISLFAAALAVLQDSRSLAVLGFTGGFLAPILTSDGSNNYIGLFSYYIILNIAIVAIAWFKAWRELNLLGFLFTFVVGAAWGYSAYQTENFATIEPFLVIFFLFYVLIAILFSLRQPEKLRGYVDGSLLFGVPLAASGLQYALVKDFEYGISISSFAIGVFYLVLAWFLWKKAGNALRLLAEAFLALGMIFTSLAIPFALATNHTAAAWGLEGLGLIWLGSRQNHLSVRAFGLLLQLGAGILLVYGFIENLFVHNTETPFINATFISALMMAVAGILSARLLATDFSGSKKWEKTISNILLIWGLAWLFSGTLYQIVRYFDEKWLVSGFLLLATAVSLMFIITALRTKPQWKQAWTVAIALLPAMIISALIQSDAVLGLNIIDDHPFRYGGWLAWPLAFSVLYAVIFQLDKHPLSTSLRPIIHTLSALLLVIIITWQGAHQLLFYIAQETAWAQLWFAIPATLTLWFIMKANNWPIKNNRNHYLQQTGAILAIYLILWGLFTATTYGSSDPLPWIPLLNPLDITLVIVLLTLYKGWQSSLRDKEFIATISLFQPNQSLFAIGIAGLTFLWLNFTLFRIASHWFDVPYNAQGIYHSNLVQTAVSVLWALSGVLLTIYASRQKMRVVWIAGGILLGVVVVKLFTVDLSSLSSLARIVSFLVVGILLTSIGYFAPLPDGEEG